ncbi:MAG TPA: hypothetical protein VGK99_16440 [Acidobacteriota bacterium]|jgi:hypothetical protein
MDSQSNAPKNYEKPLFAHSYPKEAPRRGTEPVEAATASQPAPASPDPATAAPTHHSKPAIWLPIALGVIVALVLFAFHYTRSSKEELQREVAAKIAATEEQTSAALNRQLQESEKQRAALQNELESNKAHFGQELSQTRNLYASVRKESELRQKELKQALDTKAENSQVSTLKSEQETVKTNVVDLNNQVSNVKTELGSVKDVTSKHGAELEQHSRDIAANRENIGATSQDLKTFKSSFDREVLTFELPKNGSYVKVGEIALRLSKTSDKKSQFTVTIQAGSKVLTKKDRNLNEPIYFYVDGYQRPLELVIDRVDKSFVTGKLSVPKKS